MVKSSPGLWKDGLIVDLKMIFPSIPDIGETFFRGKLAGKNIRRECPWSCV